MTVLSFGKIIVRPRVAPAAVKRDNERASANPDTDLSNVVVLGVAHVTHKTISEDRYNDIQKIVAKTMRSQRYTKRSSYAIEKLRKMFLNPG